MALKAILFSVLIGHSGGNEVAPTVTMTQQVIDEGGFSTSIDTCHKFEEAIHLGADRITKVGNKTISYLKSMGDTTETKTWCVEY